MKNWDYRMHSFSTKGKKKKTTNRYQMTEIQPGSSSHREQVYTTHVIQKRSLDGTTQDCQPP